MIKRFFLVAIAAMTLSLGFTSCSDENDENKCEITYQVRFRNDNSESTYLSKVVSAYKTCLGLSDDETVTVGGLNRDICDSLLALKVISAVDQIKSVEWEDTTVVEIFVKGNDKCIFQVVYAPASNSDEFVGRRSLHSYPQLNYGESMHLSGNGMTEAITNIHVEAHDCEEYVPFTNKLFTMNLNSGNGGKYIYITFDQTDKYEDAVTDLVVAKPKNGVVEPTIQWQGRTYYVCDSEEARKNNSYACVSLNAGTNGEPYYLYYTKDKVDGEHIGSIVPFYTENWVAEYNTNFWGRLYWLVNQKYPIKKRYLEYSLENMDEEGLKELQTIYYTYNNEKLEYAENLVGHKVYNMRWGQGRVVQVVSDSNEPEYCCTNKGALGFNIYLYMSTVIPR